VCHWEHLSLLHAEALQQHPAKCKEGQCLWMQCTSPLERGLLSCTQQSLRPASVLAEEVINLLWEHPQQRSRAQCQASPMSGWDAQILSGCFAHRALLPLHAGPAATPSPTVWSLAGATPAAGEFQSGQHKPAGAPNQGSCLHRVAGVFVRTQCEQYLSWAQGWVSLYPTA